MCSELFFRMTTWSICLDPLFMYIWTVWVISGGLFLCSWALGFPPSGTRRGLDPTRAPLDRNPQIFAHRPVIFTTVISAFLWIFRHRFFDLPVWWVFEFLVRFSPPPFRLDAINKSRLWSLICFVAPVRQSNFCTWGASSKEFWWTGQLQAKWRSQDSQGVSSEKLQSPHEGSD